MKKISIVFLFFITITVSAVGFADANISSDVVYGHKDGMALIYDVIRPDNQNGAAIIYMVSGGWFSRWAPAESRASQFVDLLEAGFTVIPVHHGSAPRYLVPEAYADVSRAIRHIHMNADSYGIDADRLGVTGGSAGGHLSLMLGLDSDTGNMNAEDEVLRYSNQVAAVVAYYPPVDMRTWVGPSPFNERFEALDFDRDLAPTVSPILFADPEDPPTLLIHGDADDLVVISNSEVMQAEFEKQGVVSDFITIPGAGHGFRDEDAVQAAKARLAWFSKHLH
jgi:acetyl esterase/lipase